jgi:hypothetical protein
MNNNKNAKQIKTQSLKLKSQNFGIASRYLKFKAQNLKQLKFFEFICYFTFYILNFKFLKGA